MPLVIGGWYGLSSKEFTPGMVAGIFAELAADRPRPRFTIGITDDVTAPACHMTRHWTSSHFSGRCGHCSSGWARTGPWARTRTASRSSAPIRRDTSRPISSTTRRNRGRRRSPPAVRADPNQGTLPHQPGGLCRLPPGADDRPTRGAGTRCDRGDGAAQYPVSGRRGVGFVATEAQEQILAKALHLYAIDASKVARDAGLGGRVNTVLQTCFFAISGVMPGTTRSRPSRKRDRQDLRPAAAPRSSRATTPRWTRPWRHCTGSSIPGG